MNGKTQARLLPLIHPYKVPHKCINFMRSDLDLLYSDDWQHFQISHWFSVQEVLCTCSEIIFFGHIISYLYCISENQGNTHRMGVVGGAGKELQGQEMTFDLIAFLKKKILSDTQGLLSICHLSNVLS